MLMRGDWAIVLLVWTCVMGLPSAMGAEAVGKRPYEMEWARRTADAHAPLVDFESLEGWKIDADRAEGSFGRSREQQLWGDHVGKLTYRSAGGDGRIIIRPPAGIALPPGIDCVNLWVYGNRLGWSVDPKNPPAQVGVVFSNRSGKELAIPLQTVNWKEWHLLHHKLSPDQLAFVSEGGTLAGISVRGISIPEDRVLYFDNLSVYKETLAPLKFEPRPRRNVGLFEGQSPGLNTGPGTLPFPTRPATILPENLEKQYGSKVEEREGTYVFTYAGADGVVEYRYRPAAGDLSDLEAACGGATLRPMSEGGVRFAPEEAPAVRPAPAASKGGKPEKAQLISCAMERDRVRARWRIERGGRAAEVTYILQIWQKSLVIDILAPGGQVGEVVFGRATPVKNPRQIPVPFLDFRQAKRPLTLLFDTPNGPRFLSGYVDWYRTNASELFNADETGEDFAQYNGGSRYVPKTDGKRNDCFERLFLTISHRFEETLPTIDNPGSPWLEAMAQRIWRAHGASNREKDYEMFAHYARHGMTGLLVTDHETGWRDGCESFTFRTRTAPGRGGDESQAEYSRKMHALGLRYGIYNNYTDYAPVNGFWDEDNVARRPDGNWLTAWYRCYTPKPSRAVEFEARLAPVIQEKFKLTTTYCDVHTAVAPWQKEDYDARVPGAGTLAGTYYAYGELLLSQRKTWNGPVYSEGGAHWMYTGLTDGNYGQDEPAQLPTQPWLVDFDLLKMHPLGATFGMGNTEMFFGHRSRPLSDPAMRDGNLDLFLTATVAFGHTGFFVTEAGLAGAARSYFMLQGAQQRYAATVVEEIRYANAAGELFSTSQALASGAHERRQIRTKYRGGCVTLVNGHPGETWRYTHGQRLFELPPAGYAIFLDEPAGPKVLAYSGVVDGHRADYACSDGYTYADGRGAYTGFEGFPRRVAADGPVIVLHKSPVECEVIPLAGCRAFGVDAGGKAAVVALDASRKEIGPAAVRMARGMAHIEPVQGAFSYVLKSDGKPIDGADSGRWRAVPGEKTAAGLIPPSARPGTRAWLETDAGPRDFVVVPLAMEELTVAGERMVLKLRSNLPQEAEATVRLGGQSKKAQLAPGKETAIDFPADDLAPGQRRLGLEIEAAGLKQESMWQIDAAQAPVQLAAWPRQAQFTECLRNGPEQPITEASGTSIHPGPLSCGGQTRQGLFMHPPYKQGVGYACAQYTIELPARAAALRCSVGKQDGSVKGDGILFRVEVLDGAERATVAKLQWDRHAWTDLEADLSKWAGKTVRLRLIADVGEANNSAGDWSCWSAMRIESLKPVLTAKAGRVEEKK